MKFPILASVLVLIAVIAFSIHRQKDITSKIQEDFWERERLANSTRRKSLDGLAYISIPLDTLPLNILIDNDIIKECIETIKALSESKIVNLTGFSNTDLKLEYGAPNITLLSQFDQRYTTLARTLQRWGKELYDNGEVSAAKSVLEFAVSTKTDISGTYKLLASIYNEESDTNSISALLPIVSEINSPMKASILESLQEYL